MNSQDRNRIYRDGDIRMKCGNMSVGHLCEIDELKKLTTERADAGRELNPQRPHFSHPPGHIWFDTYP